MGVAKCLATQEYAYSYRMWKSTEADNRKRVPFKSHFQDAYLDREDTKQTAGSAGYGSAKNVKHGEIEDDFMNLALATSARDSEFTKLKKQNGNFSTQLRQQEDQIQTFQSILCNKKVAAAT